jgi:hypothetical protein
MMFEILNTGHEHHQSNRSDADVGHITGTDRQTLPGVRNEQILQNLEVDFFTVTALSHVRIYMFLCSEMRKKWEFVKISARILLA